MSINLLNERDVFNWKLHSSEVFILKSMYVEGIIPFTEHLEGYSSFKHDVIHVVSYRGVMQMKDNMSKRRCQGCKSVVFVTRRNLFLIFISHGHFVALTWHMIHIVFNLPPPSSITNMLAIRPALYILELRHIPAWECASYFGKFEIAIMIVCLT